MQAMQLLLKCTVPKQGNTLWTAGEQQETGCFNVLPETSFPSSSKLSTLTRDYKTFFFLTKRTSSLAKTSIWIYFCKH
jgi:hypothetical protein